jgi:cytochrome c-type biogenesis protein CcmE
MTAPRRRRRRLLLVTALVAGGLLVAGAAAKGTLVYSQSPSQVLGSGDSRSVRLSGTVVPGTLVVSGRETRFALRDTGKPATAADTVDVVTRDAPPDTFREGQGAVVEGRLDASGTFVASQVIVKHSNVYRAKPPSSVGATTRSTSSP